MNHKHIYSYKTKVNNFESDDILQEVLIQFLEMSTGKTWKLIQDGEAEKYIMAMYKVNCFSATSPYQRTYNKQKTEELYDTHQFSYDEGYEICWQDIEVVLDKMDVFFVDKLVYKEYIERKLVERGYSINRMSTDSTIPRGSLDVKFKRIRTQLKSEIKKIIQKDEESGYD